MCMEQRGVSDPRHAWTSGDVDDLIFGDETGPGCSDR